MPAKRWLRNIRLIATWWAELAQPIQPAENGLESTLAIVAYS